MVIFLPVLKYFTVVLQKCSYFYSGLIYNFYVEYGYFSVQNL